MIRINLAPRKRNKMKDAEVKMYLVGKYASLGYMDNPWEMNCGTRRCGYIRKKIGANRR